MKRLFMIPLVLYFASNAYASQALMVEYRLEAKTGGHEFKWSTQVAGGSTASSKNLEDNVFVSNIDFSNFQIKKLRSPPNKPDTYEVKLVHNEQGRKNFVKVANQDRDRIYCVVVGKEIFQCLAFTPEAKGLWDKSTSIHGPFSKTQAEQLVTSMNGKPLL